MLSKLIRTSAKANLPKIAKRNFGGASTATAGPFNLNFTEEQQMFAETAKNFAVNVMAPKAAEYDISGKYPRDIFEEAWNLGLVNTHIPESAGGLGLGAIEGVLIAENLAWGCTGMMTGNTSIRSIISIMLSFFKCVH